MMRLLLSLLLLLSFLQMNAQTYPKVILPGDYLLRSRILNLALAGFNELGAVMSCHASI